MSARTIRSVTRVAPQPGSGILRPFPSAGLPHFDPFVFLDTGEPRVLGTRDIFVAPHAHRGVQPVSLLFRGRIEHRDSLGNHRTVESGGIQWLVAGSGALHEEVLGGDAEGIFHMAQLWINVPRARKMDPPEHHALGQDRVPRLDSLGEEATVSLYAGTLAGETGPAPLPTPVLLAHVQLGPGGRLTVPVPRGWTAAFTVVAGAIDALGQEGIEPGGTPVFEDDGDCIQASSRTGGEFLLMCGEPIGEPILIGGGFVVTSDAELRAAYADLDAGRMGGLTSSRA